jgi:hypothetical protein
MERMTKFLYLSLLCPVALEPFYDKHQIVMRTIFSALLFVSVTVISVAQDHLTFKGVPIDGTLSSYVAQLEKSGFDLIDTRDADIPWGEVLSGDFSSLNKERPFDRAEILKEGYATLKGDFAGYKECKVNVSTLKDKDLVSSVMVSFPSRSEWLPLSSDYISLKEMLTTKYGNPAESVLAWEDSTPSDNESKMHAVTMGRCKLETTFETGNGTIKLAIDNSFFSGFVTLTYTDKINSSKLKAKAIGDL